MKLDRNDGAGRGKYALIKVRRLKEVEDGGLSQRTAVRKALRILQSFGILEWGGVGSPDEFFAMKLKDKYAGGALYAYASRAVHDGDVEYGQEIMEMARRSGELHPNCKKPD